jgi:hypothetical protein
MWVEPLPCGAAWWRPWRGRSGPPPPPPAQAPRPSSNANDGTVSYFFFVHPDIVCSQILKNCTFLKRWYVEGTVPRDFRIKVFLWFSFPQALSIPLGLFRMFSKILEIIRSSRHAPWLATIFANFRKIWNVSNVIFRGLGEDDTWKKNLEQKISWHRPFKFLPCGRNIYSQLMLTQFWCIRFTRYLRQIWCSIQKRKQSGAA